MNLLGAPRQVLRPVLATLLLAACSEHSGSPTEPVNEGDVAVVVISDFAFSAPTLTIDRGTSVRWRSSTGTFHTVTPDHHQAFTTRQLNALGQTFDVRFDTPGRYRYYCEPHRALGMTGEVVVQ
jgi:plastocyanin